MYATGAFALVAGAASVAWGQECLSSQGPAAVLGGVLLQSNSHVAVIGAECKRWCLKSDKAWEEKCSWQSGKNCAGCLECANPAGPFPDSGGCASTCATDPLNWGKKCEWLECSGCCDCTSSCEEQASSSTEVDDGVGVGESGGADANPGYNPDDQSWVGKECARWCLQQERRWGEKCENSKCVGCDECHQPTFPASPGCAASCAADPLKWSVKCVNLYECTGCGPCVEGYNPSAGVPPPSFGPIPNIALQPLSLDHVNLSVEVQEGETSPLQAEVSSGLPYALSLKLLGLPVDPAPVFSLEGSAPTGLSVNARSGVLFWQPGAEQVGSHSVHLSATAGPGGQVLRELTLEFQVVKVTENPSGVYVWPSGGSDEDGNGSAVAPFASVEKAAAVAQPGDTVYIRGGSYEAKEDVVASGTREQPVLITRLPGERVRLVAKQKRHVFNVPAESTGIVFRGLELDGNAYNDHWTVLRRSWWRTRDDEVAGGWNGFKIEGQHITVEHCVIHHFNQKGVEIGHGRYVNVRFNLIFFIGHASLSGGGGIHRKWDANFPDADDPGCFRWDVFGNAVWAVEQRVYSYIPHQKWSLLELDEGKPMSFDSTHDTEMRARIAHNLVLYGGVDHIRLMVNPNLQVYNNAVMAEPGRAAPIPDGITVKGSGGSNEAKTGKNAAGVFGGKIENMTLFNNLVHTDPGSLAFGLKVTAEEAQFSEEDNPGMVNHNYFSGGGGIRPEYMPGVASLPAQKGLSVFPDASSSNFTASGELPLGVGVDPSILQHLSAVAADYDVSMAPTGFRHDHCRNVQTIIDNAPTEHVEFKSFGKSKYKKDLRAFKFKVVSGEYKELCKCNDVELILPQHIDEHCGDFVLPS